MLALSQLISPQDLLSALEAQSGRRLPLGGKHLPVLSCTGAMQAPGRTTYLLQLAGQHDWRAVAPAERGRGRVSHQGGQRRALFHGQ